MTNNFYPSVFIPLFLLVFQVSLSAQQEDKKRTYSLEFQGALGVTKPFGISDDNNSFTYFGTWTQNFTAGSSDIYQTRGEGNMKKGKGYNIQLGLLYNLDLGESFWLQSGTQLKLLKGEKDIYVSKDVFIQSGDLIGDNDRRTTVTSTGIQFPVLMEYRESFHKWSPYGNIGISAGYSLVRERDKYESTIYYNYNSEYNDSCSCFLISNINELSPPKLERDERSKIKHKLELNGVLGFGALFQSSGGKTWRLGYRFSSNLFNRNKPFNKLHQLTFSLLLPEKESIFKKSNKIRFKKPNKIRFKKSNKKTARVKDKFSRNGWFTGIGFSLLYHRSKDQSRRLSEYFRWGPNFHLMYISDSGLGARLEVTLGNSTKLESYGSKSRIYKMEVLYQFPVGVQFFAGGSRRHDYGTYDTFKIDYTGFGVHLGTGVIVPISSVVGLQFQFSGQYFNLINNTSAAYGNKDVFTLEASIGMTFRLVKE